MNRLRAKLTYAAFAASQLPKNSFGAKQIKRGAITPAKLAAAAKRAFAAVTGPQGPPGAAGATKVVVRIGKQERGSEFLCKPGEVAISGGGIISGSGGLLYGSLPVDSKGETTVEGKAPEGWFAGGEAEGGGEAETIAYVVCASPDRRHTDMTICALSPKSSDSLLSGSVESGTNFGTRFSTAASGDATV